MKRMGSGVRRFLNRHFVRGAFGSGAAPLVINLRRRYVPAAQQTLYFPDVYAGVKQQSCGRGAEGMGCVDARVGDSAIWMRLLAKRSRKSRKVILEQAIHCGFAHHPVSQFLAPGIEPRLFADVERVFRGEEPAWKVERTYPTATTLGITFRSGKHQASVEIAIW